jgi:hypothetical protein
MTQAAVPLYIEMKKIVDDLFLVIGQADPTSLDRNLKAVLHAGLGPQVVVTVALLNKILPTLGVAPLTIADLLAAKASAYAEDWTSVAEPPTQ